MSKTKTAIAIRMTIAAAVFAASAAPAATTTILDTFGASSNTPLFSVASLTATETPSVSPGGIGNKWGAWVPGATADQANRVYFNASGSDLRFGQYGDVAKTGNIPGAYAYTIFSTTGGGASAIDASVSNMDAIVITPLALFSTLTETLRLLIRDGNGQWLISKETFSMPPGTSTPQTYSLSGLTWANVPLAAAADMDEMDADAGPGDISTFSGTVTANLTSVGGAGVYIENVEPAPGGLVFRIDSIEFQEGTASVKDWKAVK